VTDAIKVEGLREFNRSLKALDSALPKALRIALNDAADVIVSDARPRVPRRSGRAAGTVRAQSTRTRARVKGGGNRAPYYPWLDFGGSVGRKRSVRRPFLSDGRYIYNAYFRRRGQFVEALEDALVDVAEQAGFEVS
jgi:hypothetical protein